MYPGATVTDRGASEISAQDHGNFPDRTKDTEQVVRIHRQKELSTPQPADRLPSRIEIMGLTGCDVTIEQELTGEVRI